MDTSGVEFGDKHIAAARGGDITGPKVHRPGEVSSGVDVAGTIHRHIPAGVGTGAPERGRTPIAVAASSGIPRPNRRPPPNHNQQHQKAGSN